MAASAHRCIILAVRHNALEIENGYHRSHVQTCWRAAGFLGGWPCLPGPYTACRAKPRAVWRATRCAIVFTPPVRSRIAAVADCVAISAACDVTSAASGPYLTQQSCISHSIRHSMNCTSAISGCVCLAMPHTQKPPDNPGMHARS